MKTKNPTFLNNPRLILLTPSREAIHCYKQYSLWWNLGRSATLYPMLRTEKDKDLPKFLDLSWFNQ